MIRRVIAALAAIVLAVIGFVLVINYAGNADERALEDMETDDVYVAVEPIPEGTSADDLTDLVEIEQVPRRFQVTGPVTDLAELADTIAVADINAGEQLASSRFATPEQLRAMGQFQLPEEAESLHRVTISLGTAEAVGGDLTAGDTVGVFVSMDATFNNDLYVDENGEVQFNTEDAADAAEGDDEGDASASIGLSLTKLVLEKVLVTRVQGGHVPQQAPTQGEDEGDVVTEPESEILVTLALEGGQAEQLIYGMEFGSVWLSYEPESAAEDDDDVKVVQLPDQVGDALE